MYESFRAGFKEFCEQTSLHGWSFIRFDKFKLSTIFWLISIIAAILVCSQLTLQNANEYKEEVEFNVETLTANLDEVYFPAIYLINKGKMRKSTTLQLMHETNTIANDTFDVGEFVTILSQQFVYGLDLGERGKRIVDAALKCNFSKNMFKRFVFENKVQHPIFESNPNLYHNHSIQYLTEDEIENRFENLEKRAGGYFQNMMGFTQLSDFLLDLKFSGEGILHFGGSFSDIDDPRNMFVPYFKPPSNNASVREFISPSAKSGIQHGIEMVLDAEVYDGMNIIRSGGFRMGIAHPMDSELSQFHGVNLEPGKEIELSVSTHLIKTYRDIRFNAEERNCYFDDEIELDHFPSHWFRYSIDNCLLESKFQKIEEICNCTSLLAKSVPNGYEYCKGKQLQCLHFGEAENLKLGENEFITSRGEQKMCRANCNDQPFSKSVTSSKINTLSVRMLVLKKLKESCKNFKRDVLVQWYEGICDLEFEKEMVSLFLRGGLKSTY